MKVLKLTVKRKWFDMIASGKKREEYREPKKWIEARVGDGKSYDFVEFRNGYNPESPTVLVEYRGFRFGRGRVEWGAEHGKKYIVIGLGRVIGKNEKS